VDLGVVQIDLRHAQLRLCGQNLGCQGSLVGNGVIDIGSLAGRRSQQRLRSGELDVRVGKSSAGVSDSGLLLLHRRLERRALQTVEQITLSNLAPSVNRRSSRKAVTRAVKATRSIA
jgi:hypothetical protein